jgi:vesicle transport through interaction with t-SNAREs protein 1
MSNFDAYDQEYQKVYSLILRKIKSLPNFAGERKKVAIRETEKEIEDAESLIRQMDQEINATNNNPMRARLQPKVKGYQTDIQRARRELQQAATQASNATNRDDLFAGGGNQDYQVQFLDQRTNLLAGNERLGQTSDRLQNAHRLAVQNETIGTNVLGELHGQRQQIIRATNKLDEVDDHVRTSRTILTGMARRVATNKMILAFIILMLVAAIGLIIYLKWIR